ncbi:MAG TPA: Sir2 family NAD-dependent protein deacetylase, partial [Intrasporangium sp.]|nr:Sir2 family NAD-dependent protein deacetylase [Intrasporangium sp.]
MTVPEAVAAAARSASRVVVLSGAGMSAESGVPTFRDAQTGLWERFA